MSKVKQASNTDPSDPHEAESLLAQSSAAVLSFDQDLRVNRVFAPAVAQLFTLFSTPVDENIADLLFGASNERLAEKKRFAYELALAFGADPLQWEISHAALPKQITLKTASTPKVLQIRYSPIFDDQQRLTRVVLTLDDITNWANLEKTSHQQRLDWDRLSNVLTLEDAVFVSFLEEADRIVGAFDFSLPANSKEKIPETELDVLMRVTHTLKGSAGLFHLSHLQDLCHSMEDLLTQYRAPQEQDASVNAQHLAKALTSIKDELKQYARLRSDVLHRDQVSYPTTFSKGFVFWLLNLIDRFSLSLRNPHLTIRDIDGILYEMQRAVDQIGKTKLEHFISRYDQMLLQMSKQNGKRINPIHLSGNYLLFDSKYIHRISKIINHCIANSFDHGIESPNDRIAAGKTAAGNIFVDSTLRDHTLVLTISDDGRGIDAERIRQKCLEKGYLTAKELKKKTENELIQIIFEPGFSTSDRVSTTSGRGYGMDAVVEMIEELGGYLTLHTEVGRGTGMVIALPEPESHTLPIYSLVNLRDTLRAIFPITRSKSKQMFTLKQEENELGLPIFADRLVLNHTFRMLRNLLTTHASKSQAIDITLKRQRGKRRIDSAEFYRLTVKAHHHRFQDDLMHTFMYRELQDLCERMFGNMRITSKGQLEINLPSGLPANPDNLVIDVMLWVREPNLIRKHVESYFSDRLAGLTCRTFVAQDWPEELDQPYIIIQDDETAKGMNDMAHELIAKTDSIVIHLTDDPDSMTKLFYQAKHPPLLTSRDWDKTKLFQLLELATLQLFAIMRLHGAQAPEQMRLSS